MSPQFPFQILWRAPLEGFFVQCPPPHFNDGRLSLRCGDEVIQFDAISGVRTWNQEVSKRAGDGNFFIDFEKTFITDFIRRPERFSSISAFTWSGLPQWRLDVPAILVPRGAGLVNRELFVFAVAPTRGKMFYRVDAASGSVTTARASPYDGHGFIILSPRKLLVRNSLADKNNPGMYILNLETYDATPIVAESVWSLEKRGNRLLYVTRTTSEQGRELHILAADTLVELWSSPAANEIVGFDANYVYHLHFEDNKQHLFARATDTGEVRWRTNLPRQTTSVGLAGSIVFCRHVGSGSFFWCSDGKLIGTVETRCGTPILEQDRLYLTCDDALLCAALPKT